MTLKILTVDDSKAIRRIVTRALESYDCSVFEAENGAEGLVIAKKEMPDLIILDITMPVMDGTEMLRKLKKDPELRNIDVIMLTAEGGKGNVVEVLKLGAKDYLMKPFNSVTFIDRIKKVIDLTEKNAEDTKTEDTVNNKGSGPQVSLPEQSVNFERLQNKEKQPFTFEKKDEVLHVIIHPLFTESYVDMFELAVEMVLYFNIRHLVLNLGATSTLDEGVCKSVGNKMLWVRESGCNVDVIAAEGNTDNNQALGNIRKIVFFEEAYWEEQHNNLTNNDLPFIINQQKDDLFIHFGKSINVKKNLSSFQADTREITSLKAQRLVLDFTLLEILSDNVSDYIDVINEIFRKNGVNVVGICNNIDLLLHLQTCLQGVKWKNSPDKL